MELALPPEEAAFRDEVRTFIADKYPAQIRVPNPETDLTKEQMLPWHRILYKRGWIAPLRPKQHGGAGWSITQRLTFEQATTRAGALPPLAFSITMQLHGGMGVTDEPGVGHYFRRISSINIQFGDPAYHRLRYAQLEVAA